MLIGLGAMGFDFVTRGEVSFISDHYEVFLLPIVAGAALLLISLIGWAVVLGKTGRSRIAFFTLSLSIAVILIGYAIGGTNVHGPFYLFFAADGSVVDCWNYCGDNGREFARSLVAGAVTSVSPPPLTLPES